MSNPTSFTQKAFLNSFYMDYLNPMECEERRVQEPNESIIDTLDSLEFNPYSSPYKGNAHQGMKPLRVVARMVYTLFVSLVVAPVGVLYHGTYTLKHLGTWTVKALFLKDAITTENKERVKRHLLCLLNEIWAIFQGAMTLLMLTGLPLMKSTSEMLLAGVFMIPISGCLLGGVYPQNFISRFIANPEEKIGMLISLKLRNELGLVGPDGGLLPFNEYDNVKYSQRSNRIYFINHHDQEISRTIAKLAEMILFAELDLILQVRDANQSGAKIEYQYPFNGNTIAEKIQDVALAQKFKATQRKIDLLRNIIIEVCELSVNGGYFQQIMKAIAKIKPYTHHLVASTLTSDGYLNVFRNGCDDSSNTGDSQSVLEVIQGLQNIESIDPLKIKYNPQASLYEKFKYKIGVVKSQNIAVLHKLFFLPQDFTEDQLKKQYYHLSRQLHPDKNGGSDEAKELFQTMQRIHIELQKELKERK